MNHTTDAIVVGAGVVGSSTALELARSGFRVLMIDKEGGPGFGSTSASSAVVRFNYSTWDGMAAAWESKHRWEKWSDHLGAFASENHAKFVKCGLAFLDVDVMPRGRMAEMFDLAAIPYEQWGPAELSAAFPGIDAGRYYPPKPVASDEFFADASSTLGAIYTPDAGYVDDPRLAAANLAGAAQAHGATLLFKRRVTEIVHVGGNWTIRLDDGDTVEAPVVVNAAGPWSSKINEMAGVGSEFRVRVAPMRQEVHHVAAPSPLDRGMPIIADADLGIYMRGEADGKMLVGGTEPECDPLEWIDDPDTVNVHATSARFEAQVLRAARRLPNLAVPNRPRGIVGVYDAAEDWTPVYDRTDADGFFVAIGTSGNQFKNAPLVGSLMAALILAVSDGVDHDRHPIQYRAPHTGHTIDMGSFSRLRSPGTTASSGTVLG